MKWFQYDERLQIEVPVIQKSWDKISKEEQENILTKWEKVRGRIPDRIKELEKEIENKQAQLNEEENFEASCILNIQIADLASVINDLWIWYRINQTINSTKIHS
ncbi:radical SAM protein [Metabacillus arenae]|uniref:Radical SAM protein n=1 Tax=Metabacillus arenae TaxID=2771434 RepID=A0A926RWN9_9BACI|nr:radical SAM protein [Metabacillus arenae]MBD1380116.1 radical SAM protein [Metabacillus arenae]